MARGGGGGGSGRSGAPQLDAPPPASRNRRARGEVTEKPVRPVLPARLPGPFLVPSAQAGGVWVTSSVGAPGLPMLGIPTQPGSPEASFQAWQEGSG